MQDAKYIAPITSSRSFLVVDTSDAISWYVYPLISDTLPFIYQGAFDGSNSSDDGSDDDAGGYLTIDMPVRLK